MESGARKTILSEFILGDLFIRYYLIEQNQQVEWLIVPHDSINKIKETKFSRGSSLAQIKMMGDAYPGSYAGGLTMLNSETVERYFKYEKQVVSHDYNVTTIDTYLRDQREYELIHHVCYKEGDAAITSWTTFNNHSKQNVTLELLSSFCLTEITPFTMGEATHTLKVHRIQSKWSQEGRLLTQRIEDLQLEPNWSKWQPHSERFGQVGSLPVKKFFPFVAIEDEQSDVIWGIQLGCESSWQMEIYRKDDAICLCGGIADREFGHWTKQVAVNESFTTPKAFITSCHKGINHVSQRLTKQLNRIVDSGPVSEQHLPILFNEYCTTWGLPSHENIASIIEAIKGKGIEYFVIDCGWFVEEGKNWAVSMGDYHPSPKLFPLGLEQTVKLINEAGMKAGIWFEIDNVGEEAATYHDESHLLKRDGYVLTTANRRFWDMRQPWVQEHLATIVIDQLKQYGFEYIKMDYNDTIGLGCDGAESLGEGLRQNVEASINFIKRIKEEVPNIVIENCASGGHKLEPLMMSLCSMASFSDAHETIEIPIIAANLHRTILPRQSQIWAVIRQESDLKRIAYLLSSTFLGRMCLSGDVTNLSEKQWQLIEESIKFYQLITPIIKYGYSYFYEERLPSDRHPEGWQAIVRVQTDPDLMTKGKDIDEGDHLQALITIHTFDGRLPEVIKIPLPSGCPQHIHTIYSDTPVDLQIKDGVCYYKPTENRKGIGVYLCQS